VTIHEKNLKADLMRLNGSTVRMRSSDNRVSILVMNKTKYSTHGALAGIAECQCGDATPCVRIPVGRKSDDGDFAESDIGANFSVPAAQ
jgi:hypothetical protein